MKDLSNYRKSYEKSELLENTIPGDAIQLFHKWFYEAEEQEKGEVNAMTVSSMGLDGFPKSRVVLLKKFNEEGFIFYTNYESEKGKAILANPKVCLSFFWSGMERQVIIKGIAEKTSDYVSESYFDSRPTGSKLGAIVSAQSQVIPSREYLDMELKRLEAHYSSQEISRPLHWGGFLVKPISIEFWQGRANRLHDRIRYELQEGYNWKIERLAP